MKSIMIVFGTRPEAIKLAPVIKKFSEDNFFKTIICNTGQHKEMVEDILTFFKIVPDLNLDIMTKNQTISDMSALMLNKFNDIFISSSPDFVLVQGDTTSAFIAALAAYYKKIPVIHVEAGLRTNNKYSPYPEEMNRRLISAIASYHFAPTQSAVDALNLEGINSNIFKVGNTVIDSLKLGLSLLKKDKTIEKKFNKIDFSKKIILVTAHRRENQGKSLENILKAIYEIVNNNKNVEVIFPVHLNPNVQSKVLEFLSNIDRVHLFKPFDYMTLIWVMKKSFLILTDSGGIQEEAPSLGVPVLVLRNHTERVEAIKIGIAKLVGTNTQNIIKETNILLNSPNIYKNMSIHANPYGDGKSSARIVKILRSKI